MKKIQIALFALSALALVACGSAATKEEACSCQTDATAKSVCESTWDACDSIDGGDSDDCKNELQDLMCP